MTATVNRYSLSLLLMGLSSQVSALGLDGAVQLHSYLNEPLSAQVGIIGLNDIQPEEIRVQLADTTEFEKESLSRPYFLNQLKFAVERAPNGQPIVSMTSQTPIKEPFIELLVSMNWPGGELVRSYTLLLDPSPVASKNRYARFKMPAVATTVTPKARPIASTSAVVSHATQADALTGIKPGSTFGPTTNAHTLWRIAAALAKEQSATTFQAMLAIQRKNPGAFIRQNVNGLKQGQTLQLPTLQEMQQISHSEAQMLLKTHKTAWQRGETLGVTTQATVSTQSLVSETPSSIAANSVVDQDAVNPTAVRPLTLLQHPATATADSNEPIASLANQSTGDRLNMLEEALDTLKQVNQDLLTKQATLEEQNASLNDLLAVRDEEIQKLLAKVQEVLPMDEELTALLAAEPKLTAFEEDLYLDDNAASAPITTVGYQATSDNQTRPVTNATTAISSSQVSGQRGAFWWWLPVLLLGGSGAAFWYMRKNQLTPAEAKAQVEAVISNLGEKLKSRRAKETAQTSAPVTVPTAQTPNVAKPTPQAAVAPKVATQSTTKTSTPPAFDIDDAIAVFSDTNNADKTTQVDNTKQDEARLTQLSDIDIYLTYERYDAAEALIAELLAENPHDITVKVKQLELLMKTNQQAALPAWVAALPADTPEIAPTAWQKIQTILKPIAGSTLTAGQAFELLQIPEAETPFPDTASEPDKPTLTLTDDESSISTKQTQEDEERHQEMATKLELARAYLQMDDKAGAHQLIQAVLDSGDEQLVAEAQALLKSSGQASD